MQRSHIDFDQTGALRGRYTDQIHSAIPETALEVDEGLFNATIAETDGIWRLDADGSISKHPVLVSLDNRKQGRLKGLGEAMETVLLAGFATSLGIKMDATLEALQKLKTAYDSARLVAEMAMTVVDYNNVPHPNMPLADVETLLKEVGGNYRGLYMQKQVVRGQVSAAATAEAVAAVVWPG